MSGPCIRVKGEDVELSYPFIEGAENLMALVCRNNLELEIARKAEELRGLVARQSQGISANVPHCTGHPASSSEAPQAGSSSSASHEPAARPPPRPPLPIGIQNLVGRLCSMPIQKQITASDVNHGLCRLLFPRSELEELLPQIELDPNEIIKPGMPVKVYGPQGTEYTMNFTRWSEKYYVLNSKSWNNFCRDHNLHSLINAGRFTVWMFRHTQTNDVCFAINFQRG